MCLYLRDSLPLLVELLLLDLNPLCLSEKGHPLSSLGIRIQLQHRVEILKRVLLESGPLHILLNGPHNRLHLIRINNPGEVRIHHLGPGKQVSLLLLRGLIKRPVN